MERAVKFRTDSVLIELSGGKFSQENKGLRKRNRKPIERTCLEGHFLSEGELGLRE